MKSSAEILREHIDLVRGIDEGLASAAMGAIGAAMAGSALSNWFSSKPTTPSKSSASSSSSSDDIDIGKMDASDNKDTGTQQSGLRNGGQKDGEQDRLGYTPEDYVDQSIVPVAASVGLPQGQGRYYRVLRAITRARERAGMATAIVLNTWDCAGSSMAFGTSNMPWSYASELNKVGSAGGGWEQAFGPMGLDILVESKARVEPNQFGGATVDYFVLMKKTGGNPYVFASLEQVVPFRTEKGPGLREMWIDFFGPKKTWDNGGHDQLQALFSSFKLSNGAQELKPKGES